MDINFHYFAIKSLAVRAGFSPADAQTMAEYSQFVDDYDRDGTVRVTDVPEFARHLAKKDRSGWRLYCTTTGFSSFMDMAGLIQRKRQKHICIPFHFIPRQALNARVEDDALWRTEPETLGQPTLLRGMLEAAEARYKQNPGARENLIGLAILLHIFADTYAHQRFSGYGGWWNHGGVVKKECNTGKRLRAVAAATKRLDGAKDKLAAPSIFIGHMSFGTAPDKSSLRFTAMQQTRKGGKLDLKYTRDNTQVFLEASRRIADFMRRCLGKAPMADAEWAELEDAMRQGFLTQESKVNRLAAHWRGIFPDIEYDYDPGKVLRRSFRVPEPADDNLERQRGGGKKRAAAEAKELARLFFGPPPDTVSKDDIVQTRAEVVFSPITDDFFWFNVFAKNIRDTVNGVVTPLN